MVFWRCCFYLSRPDITSRERVASQDDTAGRDEVESLVLHLVPTQVMASGSRDWGGPVFDSLMLKLALSTCTGRRMKEREYMRVSIFYDRLSLFYGPSMGTFALFSNVGLLAILWSVYPFGGVLPLEWLWQVVCYRPFTLWMLVKGSPMLSRPGNCTLFSAQPSILAMY